MIFDKHFSKYYLKYFITFLIGAITLVVVDYAQLYIPEFVGEIIDAIHLGEKGAEGALTKAMLQEYTIKLFIVAVVVFFGRFLWRVCIFGNGVKIEKDIRNEMFLKMEKLSQEYYSQNKTGALMALYTNDISSIRQVFGSGTLMLVDSIALGLLAIYKMLSLNIVLALLCIIPLAFTSLFSLMMEKKISRVRQKNLEAYTKLSDFSEEHFKGIDVIKSFVKEKKQSYLFGNLNKINSETAIDSLKVQNFTNTVITSLLSISLISIIFIGGILIYQASTGKIVTNFTIGKLTTFNAYFDSLIWPIMAVGDLINLRANSIPAEKRLAALFDTAEDINDLNATESTDINDYDGSIKFEHLSFTYPNSDIEVLHDISFDINNGEFFGIMGKTGCGKTTIVELLMHLYNLDSNKLYISNKDIMSIPVRTNRDLVAYVPQDNFLFKESILNNIAFSKSDVNRDDAIKFAEIAGLEEDLKYFSDGDNEGIDTIIGERGMTVSGGQKQRISIARALIKDAKILILDDALSAVDMITEKKILEALKEIRRGKTTIFIAHRISTLETLDRILVMDDGKVVDIGTHEELINRCNIYNKEVQLQKLEEELEDVE